jgi:hypothetical protein
LAPPHTAKNNVQTTTYERSERGLKIRFILRSKSTTPTPRKSTTNYATIPSAIRPKSKHCEKMRRPRADRVTGESEKVEPKCLDEDSSLVPVSGVPSARSIHLDRASRCPSDADSDAQVLPPICKSAAAEEPKSCQTSDSKETEFFVEWMPMAPIAVRTNVMSRQKKTAVQRQSGSDWRRAKVLRKGSDRASKRRRTPERD